MSLRSIATDASQVSPPFYIELSRGLPGCGLNTELENLLRVALGVCYVSTRSNIWGELCKEINQTLYQTVSQHIHFHHLVNILLSTEWV